VLRYSDLLLQRNQLPVDLASLDLEPGHASRRAAIRARNTPRIQKQNAAAFFISRNVSMTMQDNIDIVRGNIRRNVHQPKFQSLARKVDHQRPIRIPIAISAHDGERRPDRLQIVGDRRFANVAKVPNLIRALRQIENGLWKFVMRISENKDFHRASARKAPNTKSQLAGKSQAPMSKQLSADLSYWDLELRAHCLL
jgi:hypothetical protein